MIDAKSCVELDPQVFKDKGYPPLWLLSLGSLTTLAAAAVITQLYSNNKRLTLQLRQRDRVSGGPNPFLVDEIMYQACGGHRVQGSMS